MRHVISGASFLLGKNGILANTISVDNGCPQHKLPISIKVRNFVAMENFRP